MDWGLAAVWAFAPPLAVKRRGRLVLECLWADVGVRSAFIVMRMKWFRLPKRGGRVWCGFNSSALRVCFGRSACAAVSFQLVGAD